MHPMPDPLLSALGDRLRERRTALGLTQAALSRRAGVSPRFLVQLEAGLGNISVSRLAEVCTALSLPLDQLFRGLSPGGPRRVALVGLRGAGKTTVGAALAERLGVALIELDRRVEEAAGMRLGEIFEIQGEAAYREAEARVLDALLRAPGTAVIATGGSIVTAPATWRRLREGARTVWLRASPAAHLARVQAQGDLRPMLGRPAALQELEAILAARAPLYAEADLTLDTEGRSPDSLAEQILKGELARAT